MLYSSEMKDFFQTWYHLAFAGESTLDLQKLHFQSRYIYIYVTVLNKQFYTSLCRGMSGLRKDPLFSSHGCSKSLTLHTIQLKVIAFFAARCARLYIVTDVIFNALYSSQFRDFRGLLHSPWSAVLPDFLLNVRPAEFYGTPSAFLYHLYKLSSPLREVGRRVGQHTVVVYILKMQKSGTGGDLSPTEATSQADTFNYKYVALTPKTPIPSQNCQPMSQSISQLWFMIRQPCSLPYNFSYSSFLT